MAPDHHEWSLRGPARALLWWPLISFLLLAAFPDAGPGAVALAGAALAVLGTLGSAAGRLLTGRRTTDAAPTAADALTDDGIGDVPAEDVAMERRAA
ncbi:hypothetical protein [Pseudonocardia acidicola]|uniref:Uncharacterized protein n=1 Tax=Pseudonocardia acidicola TaxID=2724939 RepID=A0ABX1S8Q6_9PSEU|nr:hypothetical protein [Pseudonocardia acidicola]NMH97955.1 hypothetical protein [Pseudonocardia acidicola]